MPLSIPASEDLELARNARAGSPAAFDELVRRHHGRVFAFLISLTRHRQDAEDLTQETFVRAWNKIRHLDPTRPVLPWLLTIARRQSIAALRRKRPLPPPDPTTEPPDPWSAQADDPLARQLWDLAARTLSRDACAALWLHYREELPLAQVAQILGKRVGAVKTMLHRSRATLAAKARQPRPPSAPPPPLPVAAHTEPPPLPAQWTILTSP